MSKPSRNASPDRIREERTFFVSTRTFMGKHLLQSDRTAELLIQTLFRYRDEGKYRLHDFVVMPNHLHVLITIGPEISIEKAVQFIKGGFAREAGKQCGLGVPIWQRGFSEVRIYNEGQFLGRRKYIRENPVKAGLAETVEQYSYSSANPKFHAGAKAQSSSGT